MATTSPPTARPVARVFPAPGLHWVGDGFRVMGYMATYPELARALDPFLLIDYHPPYDYAPTARRRGVGSHPHRGFQTVTLAFDGSVAHHDSVGNQGVIGPGDVQWMSAASGILHQEYHEEAYARRGGPFHMAQLWVNLPAAHKMDAPAYHAIADAEMGRVPLPEGGELRIVAGEHAGVAGPARTYTPITLIDARLAPGDRVAFDLPADHTAAVLVMEGSVELGGATARTNQLALLAEAPGAVTVASTGAARLLLLGGAPLREPIVQHGPFVMNTAAEIVQAFADFDAGKFGEL